MRRTATNHWQDRKELGSPFWLKVAGQATRRLPRWLGRCLLVPTALYFLASQPAVRAASRQGLERTLNRRPNLLDLFRHLYAFATVAMDRAYFLQGNLAPYAISIDGESVILELLQTQRGGFLMGAHIGSFEAARALGRHRSRTMRFAMVMYEDNARMMNAMLEALQPGLQQEIIGLGRPDSMLRVMHALDAGALVGVLADRTTRVGDGAPPAARGDQQVLPFLGKPAHFPLGPFRLAALMRRPVVLMLGLFEGGNRYRLVFEPIADFSAGSSTPPDTVEAAQARYVARLEHHLRAHPYNWFNFFDFWALPDDDPQSAPGRSAASRPPRRPAAPLSLLTGAAIATALGAAMPEPALAQTPALTTPAATTPAAPPAAAAVGRTATPTLEALLARIGGQARQEARFVETLHVALLDTPVESSGVLRYAAPGRLEKRVEKPRPEALILDGDLLVLERDGRKRSMPAAQLPGVAALVGALRDVLGGHAEPLRKLFRVEIQGSAARWQMDLLPADVDAATLVNRITLFGGQSIERIETRLADGDRSDLRILP